MDGLSERQKQVLELLAHGHSSKEIGKRLGTSPETIRKHLANIRDVLGIRRAAELAAYWHSRNKSNSLKVDTPTRLLECLTNREREVARLLVKGLSAKEVATVLGIAPGTVAKHRENLLGKVGVRKTSLLSSILE